MKKTKNGRLLLEAVLVEYLRPLEIISNVQSQKFRENIQISEGKFLMFLCGKYLMFLCVTVRSYLLIVNYRNFWQQFRIQIDREVSTRRQNEIIQLHKIWAKTTSMNYFLTRSGNRNKMERQFFGALGPTRFKVFFSGWAENTPRNYLDKRSKYIFPQLLYD